MTRPKAQPVTKQELRDIIENKKSGIILLEGPSAIGKTAIHVGNAMCLLSSLLLGPVPGALAAGIGSALVDLTDPVWATEFWMTFINKAAMALTAGLCFRVLRLRNRPLRVWLSSLSGALV